MKQKDTFYLNEKGEVEFNKLCQSCSNKCKQSCNVTLVFCPKRNDKKVDSKKK